MNARIVIGSLALAALVACTPKPTAYQATLYFADRDLRYLVPVTETVTATPAELPAKLVEGLKAPPSDLTSVLPEATVIRKVERQGDAVTVILEPPQSGLQGAAMVQEALALSLVGTDGIQTVSLHGLPKGESSLDFSQPGGRPEHPNRWLEAGEQEGTWITVAWQTPDRHYLVPVSIPAGSDAAATRLALWQKGPSGGRKALLRGLWDAKSPLTLVGQNGQTVSVALPAPWPQVDWSPALRALAWTLTESQGVEHVQLTGKDLPPTVPAGGRLDRPAALNLTPHS